MLPATPSRPFGAVLTAMVTPMREDGSVDLDAAVSLATHLVDHGHDGLVLNGTTGESPATHAPEKAELIRAVVDAVGDRAAVVAGAGSNDTLHAVRMAEQAADAGADGLLVVSPYYSRPSQTGVVRHIQAVADSTPLPVMLYDVPGRTGVRFAQPTLDALAAHERVVAMKDATGDLYAAATLPPARGWPGTAGTTRSTCRSSRTARRASSAWSATSPARSSPRSPRRTTRGTTPAPCRSSCRSHRRSTR